MAFSRSEFLSHLEDVGLSELVAALGAYETSLVSPDDQVESGEEVEAIFYMKDTDYIDSDGYFISPVFYATTNFDYEDHLEKGSQMGIQYSKFYDDDGETITLFSATYKLQKELYDEDDK